MLKCWSIFFVVCLFFVFLSVGYVSQFFVQALVPSWPGSTPSPWAGLMKNAQVFKKRYKQICNILSVERGLSPPDEKNNINFLLRHTLVLVLDCSHRMFSFLSVVLFLMSYMYDCGTLLHRNYTMQMASAADHVNPNSGCVRLFTFCPILYFSYF